MEKKFDLLSIEILFVIFILFGSCCIVSQIHDEKRRCLMDLMIMLCKRSSIKAMSDSIMHFNSGFHSFYGLMEITVVSGSPTVLGAELQQGFSDNFFAPIYSLPLTFESQNGFSLKINSLSQDYLAPNEIRFYIPSSVPEGYQQITRGVYYSTIMKGALFPPPSVRFIDNITKRKPSSILIAGSKGSGKSTFARFAVNRILNSHNQVAFLDLDPGQPEFNLPGTISLYVVDKYLFGPPEHQTKILDNEFNKSVFYGSPSVGDNLDFFMQCVAQVLTNIPNNTYLVINSFGWIKDLGFDIHQKLIEILKPGATIVVHKSDEKPEEINTRIFRVEVQPKSGIFSISPKEHRELRISTYFRRQIGPISYQQPLEIPLNSVRFAILHVPVDPSEILTAVNGSVVALCFDDRKFSRPKTKVSILKEVFPFNCQGFGLIRAIDKDNNKLYLLTFLEPTGFNTVLLGPVNTPPNLYLDTPRCNPNYLGIGILDKVGASTDPLVLKNATVYD